MAQLQTTGVTGSLTVTGQIIAQSLNVQQVTSSIVYSSGSNRFGSLTSNVQEFTGSLRVTGSGNHWIVGGNVGIDTPSPTYKLQVNGTANGLYVIGANVAPFTQTIASFVYGGNNNSINVENQGGKASFQARDNASAVMDLHINPAGGNVGIGTTTPTGSLQVHGTLSISNNSVIGQGSSYGTPSAANFTTLKLYDSSTGDTVLNNQGYNIQLQTAGSSKLTILNGGNVGIGTTNPSLAKLQVNGNVHATSFTGSLSGNATSATSATSATTAGTVNGAFGQLLRNDNRIISASEITAGYLQFGFTSWNNNAGSPYADFLHMRSYTDASGGNDNLVMFRKDAIGVRVYQAPFGVTSSYSTYKDLAFTDGTNASGTWPTASYISPSGTNAFIQGGNSFGTTAIIGTNDAQSLVLETNGSTKVTIDTSGNVGIGTTSPTGKLQINTGTASNNALTIQADTVTARTYGIGITSTAGLTFYDNTATTSRLFINSDGNVGIGTTTPTGSLQVHGTLSISNNAVIGQGSVYGTSTASSFTTLKLYDSSTGDTVLNNQAYNIQLQTAGSSKLTILNNGNVGIGTTSPLSKLQISAGNNADVQLLVGQSAEYGAPSIRFKTAATNYMGLGFTLGSAVANEILDAIAIQRTGNIGIGTTSPVARLDVTGNGRFTSTLTSGARIQAQGSNGAGTTQGGFWINYNANANSRSWLINNDYNVFGDFAILQTTTQTGDTFDPKLYIKNDGNVGIGTTNPSLAKLQVQGNVWAQSFTGSLQGTASFAISSSIAITSSFAISASWAPSIGGSSQWTSSGANIYYNIGNVGIGTTSPGANLQVGGANISTSEMLRLSVNYSGGAGQRGVISWHDTSGITGKIWTTFDGSTMTSMNFGGLFNSVYDQGTYLTIQGNGNIGIGTTTPGQKLDVIGRLRFRSDTSTTPGFWLTDNTGTENVFVGLQSTTSTSAFGIYSAGSWRFTILNGGNVGIGTTSPASKFEIKSSATNNLGGLLLRATSTDNFPVLLYENSSNGGTLDLYNAASLTTRINSNGDSYFNVGNIGIGTTSPVFKLDINGITRISNTLRIDGFDTVSSQRAIGFGGNTLGTNAVIYSNGSYIAISPATSQPLYLNSDTGGNILMSGTGNVGIGTTSPSVGKLQINTGAASNNAITLQATSQTSITYGIGINGSSNFAIYDNLSTTTRLVLNGDGNIGIGTTVPNALLDVAGGINSRNTRVDATRKYPIGHYSSGDAVFEINPTWTQAQLQDYFGSTAFTWNTDSTAPGGYAIQIDGAVNVGNGAYSSGFPYIPVDTGSNDWYYMECWIRNEAGSQIRHYMGGIDYNASFGVLGGNPGSFTYNVMLNYNPGTTWTKVFGYWNGYGSSSGGNGTGNTNNWINNTKYFGPQALFNYETISGTSRCYISGWRLIKISNSGNIVFNDGLTSSGGTLGTTSGDRKILQTFTTKTANTDNLEITNIRIGNGADWFTAGHRIQQKVDGFWMGYIQFNGGNNSGISIGTGLSNSLPTSVPERIRITDAGNIGIGTTDVSAAKLIIASNGNSIKLQTTSDSINYYATINSNYDYANAFSITANGAGGVQSLMFWGDTAGLSLQGGGSRPLFLQPSNGNVGIGTTIASYKLDVTGTIRATGDVIAYSDARVKDNVKTIENALEKIISLRGVSYTRKDTDDKSTKIGVIAQEVLSIIPEVVSKDQHGNYSVSYGNMVGLLIEAVKEQQKQIDELKYLLKSNQNGN